MNIKKWVVTAVDFDADGQCDGKARTLAICKSEDEAKNFILEDMREYVDNRANEGFTINEAKLRVADRLDANGCEWNLKEVEIEWWPILNG